MKLRHEAELQKNLDMFNGGRIDVRSGNGDYQVRDRSSVIRPIGENPQYTVLVRVRSGSIEISR
jgi:hypothetical protein